MIIGVDEAGSVAGGSGVELSGRAGTLAIEGGGAETDGTVTKSGTRTSTEGGVAGTVATGASRLSG